MQPALARLPGCEPTFCAHDQRAGTHKAGGTCAFAEPGLHMTVFSESQWLWAVSPLTPCLSCQTRPQAQSSNESIFFAAFRFAFSADFSSFVRGTFLMPATACFGSADAEPLRFAMSA